VSCVSSSSPIYKLTDLVAVANLAKTVVDIVRVLTGHN
jgi:hypothetical protein